MMDKIKLIEIEIFNYCNRKCDFCPNSQVPSRQDKNNAVVMDYELFMGLIDQIAHNKYLGIISFSRYNEPLAFKNTTKKYVDYLKSKLHVKVVSNTNGDFLTKDALEIFDELTIMDYPGKGKIWWQKRLEKFGCYLIEDMSECLLFKSIGGKDVLVFLNFKENATVEDRGGTIKQSVVKFKNDKLKRQRPCFEPSKFLGIDYNGHTTICCNMNSEFHLDYTLGNINDTPLIEIVNSEKRKNYIQIMQSDKPGNYLPPCEFCQKDAGRYTRTEPSIFYMGERK